MKKTKIIAVLVQILILVGILAAFFAKGDDFYCVPGIQGWSSDFASFVDDGWYINHDTYAQLDVDYSIVAVKGPYIQVPKGYYTAKVYYETTADQVFYPCSNSRKSAVKIGECVLDRHLNYAECNFKVTEPVDDLEIQIIYDGCGELKVTNIEIDNNNIGVKKLLVSLFILFILADLLIWNLEWVKENCKEGLFLCGVLFFMALPLSAYGINAGNDLPYHLMRIEGLAKELGRGIFPVRMQSIWFNGYGYSTSIYYGDTFLYLPAMLRNIGFSVMEAYKAYILFVEAFAVVISYISFKGIFKSKEIGCVCTMANCLAYYTLYSIAFGMVGQYTALIFVPLIAWSVYSIYTEDADKYELYKYSAIMAVGMSAIVCTHVVTAVVVVFSLLIICVLFAKKTFTLKTIKAYIVGALGTLLLSAWFLIPFMDYYMNVSAFVTDHVGGNTSMQDRGLYLAHLFSFDMNMFGVVDRVAGKKTPINVGLLLMSVFIVALVRIIKKKADYKLVGLMICSAICLFATLTVFPWDFIEKHIPLFNIFIQTQFPWRYFSGAVVIITMILGLLLCEYRKELSDKYYKVLVYVIVFAGVYSACAFSSDYCSNAKLFYSYDTAELDDNAVINGEYMRTGVTKYVADELLNKVETDGGVEECELLSRSGTDITVQCITGDTEGTIVFPCFNYKGYAVTAADGTMYEIQDGPNKEVQVTVPANYDGVIELKFNSFWYWRLGEVITLLSVIGILLLFNFERITAKIKKQ